ncbi:MAG: competence/damage-inducible protein A [bacterium]|nr:competence/damage-inducible protein A [bacterium]
MSNIKAEVLTIGDEILYGQITDTNSQWMSARLDEIGVKVVQKTTIGDSEEEILRGLQEAENRADIILITGGLGPTKDDLTKPTLAKYFDSEIELHETALIELEGLFKSIGRELTDINRKQAELPVKCEMISNKLGTAPGMWFHERGKVFVSMPGVPYEMKAMISNYIIPKLMKTFSTDLIHHKLIRTIGIGESWLSEMIEDWESNLPDHIKLAYLPSPGEVKLRLTATGSNKEQLEQDVEDQIAKVLPKIDKYVFGYNKETIQSAIGKMLNEAGLTIATAESCTGGFVAHQITSIPGSSAYFMGSVIAYDNAVKENQLGVSVDTMKNHGAVSEETALEMAKNVRKVLNTDIGISTTGIAGPDGGTETKPVGTIWIAYADENQAVAKQLKLSKTRDLNIKLTAVNVLNLLRQQIKANFELSVKS